MNNSRVLMTWLAGLICMAGCLDSTKKTSAGPHRRPPSAQPYTPPPSSPVVEKPRPAPAQPAGGVEVLEEHYPDGTVHIRRECKRRADNVIINHGTWTEFDETGQKIGEMTYVEGVLHGPIALWYPNGQMSGEGFMEHGQKHGTFKIWDEEGRRVREESYDAGVNHGMWVYWDPQGNVTRYEHWVKGQVQPETPAQESTATSSPAASP